MTNPLRTDFRGALSTPLTPFTIGGGRIERADGIRFALDPGPADRYSDAQISDYANLSRRAYPWRPPLRMTVHAHASHRAENLRGTAGFGFWNQPFMPGQRWPRLPRAAWFFFAGAPSNMALARGVPGFGWKAATLDARRPSFLALAPTAPLGILLMRIPALYRALYPIAQWALGVAEAEITVDLRQPHRYDLEWAANRVTFRVDEQVVLRTPFAPHAPLGFIAWLDNQYAIVTPQGRIGMGVVPIVARQWLHLDYLEITG